MIFDWFKKDKAPSNVVPFPKAELTPVHEPEPEPEEHYRVGHNSEGGTTLTLISRNGSLTLTMSQDACERLIRMLRATYRDEVDDGC
jgi:hypothetical protein